LGIGAEIKGKRGVFIRPLRGGGIKNRRPQYRLGSLGKKERREGTRKGVVSKNLVE